VNKNDEKHHGGHKEENKVARISAGLNFLLVLGYLSEVFKLFFDKGAVGFKLSLRLIRFSILFPVAKYTNLLVLSICFTLDFGLVEFAAFFKHKFNLFCQTIFLLFEFALSHCDRSICPSNDLSEWDCNKASSEEENVQEVAPECNGANSVGCKCQLSIEVQIGLILVNVRVC